MMAPMERWARSEEGAAAFGPVFRVAGARPRIVESFSQSIARANCPTIVFVPPALLKADLLVRKKQFIRLSHAA